MNRQTEKDLQHRLQKLEAEVNASSVVVPQSEQVRQTSKFSFLDLKSLFARFIFRFNSLSTTGKLVILGVAVLVGFAMLQAVLKLVASVISLTLLAVLVYLGYKFFVSSNNQSKQ